MEAPDRPVPFISRVRLKNYKSIAECDVSLSPLTILIGPNGTGKSNFLDALAFLARALETTPYEAITERGGLEEILRRVPEQADSFSVGIQATVPWGPKPEQWASAAYEFEIGPSRRRGLRPFEVVREVCVLHWQEKVWQFEAERGLVREEARRGPDPQIEPDRLYLPAASIQTTYARLFNGLAGMRFYNFALDVLRQPLPPLDGAILERQGERLGDVLGALEAVEPSLKQRIDAYLSAVAPGVASVDRFSAAGYVTVALRAHIATDGEEFEFGPNAMSDGTIRAAAVLAALFQLAAFDGRIPLIGVEEPELALHPAAAGVLYDALNEASEHVQVVATSQSPDLLDREDLDLSSVRAVSMEHGLTVIGDVDEPSRRIVRDKLYTLGELMRGNQISPEPAMNRDNPPPKG